MAEALYRKYRPMTFADVTEQGHVKQTIQNQLKSSSTAHAYLFSGPRGVGKTTIARLLAKTLNCVQPLAEGSEPCNACDNCTEMNKGRALDVIEIDAASQTGVDNVRENIIEAGRFSPSKGKYKVFVIDEVHMLSTSSFNALLKTIEEPPAHVVFVLATTELHKIPATIISRCQRFDFHRIPPAEMVDRLLGIAKQENVVVDAEVLSQIARLSEGCLRDGESLLGQVLALGEGHVSAKTASLVLPATNSLVVKDLLIATFQDDLSRAVRLLNTFIDQGGSVKHLSDELLDVLRSLLLFSLDFSTAQVDPLFVDSFSAWATKLSSRRVAELLDMLVDMRKKSIPEALPQLGLEIVLTKFILQKSAEPVLPVDQHDSKKKIEHDSYTPVEHRSTAPESVAPPVVEAVVPDVVPESVVDVATPVAAVDPVVVERRTSFDVQEIRSKWKRCCDLVKKRSIAIPLALQQAELIECADGVLKIGLSFRLHFDALSEHKNMTIVNEAINEVMQSAITIKPVFMHEEQERTLGTLVEAFGGKVME